VRPLVSRCPLGNDHAAAVGVCTRPASASLATSATSLSVKRLRIRSIASTRWRNTSRRSGSSLLAVVIKVCSWLLVRLITDHTSKVAIPSLSNR
jgi:hypothetical protein